VTAALSDAALGLLLTFVFDDDGRTLGDVLIDRQVHDLRDVLDLGGPRYHLQLKPRGAGKTDLVAAALLAIAMVQAPSGSRLYVASADRDQSRLAIDSIRGYVRRTPLLAEVFDVRAYEAECRANGVVIEALAADTAGSAGLRPYVLVLDELFQWAADQPRVRAFYEFLVTAVPKVAGSRLVAISTAPHPDHAFAGLISQARADPRWALNWWTAADGLCPAPWQDQADIESVRVSLSEGAYRRLYLNEMVAGADQALATEAQLRAIFRPPGEPAPAAPGARRRVLALDLSVSGDAAGLAVARLEADRGGQIVVVERTRTWRPTRAQPLSQEAVFREVLAIADDTPGLRVVADAYQAVGLLERLGSQGLRTDTFSYSAKSKSALGAMALRLVREAGWSLPADPELARDFRELRVVERPDGTFYVEVPRSARGHGDTAEAVLLATHALLDTQPREARVRAYGRGRYARSLPDDADAPARFGGHDERGYIRSRLNDPHPTGDHRLCGRR
jgi:hypothetical protein